MITNPDLDHFIRTYVTKRPESLLKPDLEKYQLSFWKSVSTVKGCW